MKRINGLGSKTISTLIFEEGSLLEEIDAAGLQPQISSLELPESVRVVGGFSGCWNLVSVNMPGVETIKDNAFKFCELLANVSMSTSIKMCWNVCFCQLQ